MVALIAADVAEVVAVEDSIVGDAEETVGAVAVVAEARPIAEASMTSKAESRRSKGETVHHLLASVDRCSSS